MDMGVVRMFSDSVGKIKLCTFCKIEKEISQFPIRKLPSGNITYRNMCKLCMNKYKRELGKTSEQIARLNVILENKFLISDGKKICLNCFIEKDLMLSIIDKRIQSPDFCLQKSGILDFIDKIGTTLA